MLIDRYSADYRFAERHSLGISCPPDAVYESIKSVRFLDMPLVSRLLALRSGRIGAAVGRTRVVVDRAGLPVLDAAVRKGFCALEESPQSELVYGAIGRFWQPRGPGLVRVRAADEFLDFREPGYAKLVLNFHVEALPGQRCRLSTQTRVAVTDHAALYKFATYWAVIRLGSGLIRRLWLQAIAREALARAHLEHKA